MSPRKALWWLVTRWIAAWMIFGTVPVAADSLDPRSYYDLRRQALGLRDEKDLAHAATALDSLTRSFDGDGETWRRLGQVRYELGRFPEAAMAFRRAFDLGYSPRAEVAYQIGRCYARAGTADSALAWLDRSLALGFERRPELSQDGDLSSLKSLPRFRSLAGVLPERNFTREEGWRYDLDYLVSEAQRMHYVYRMKPLPGLFVEAVRTLRDRIPGLSDVGVTLEMQRMMAMLGDGHSTLYPTAGVRVRMKRVPIQLHAFADGLYVVSAPGAFASWVGARIERIGSHPVVDVMRRLEPYASKDNSNGVRILGPYLATFPAALHELGLVPDPDGLLLVGISPDGKRLSATLRVAEGDEAPHVPKLGPARFEGAPPPPRYLARVGEPYWFESLPGDSVVYFQFNQVVDGPEESLTRFAVRLRRFLDEKQTRALIIDVRHNNGGNGELLTTLVRTLIHFETTRPGARLFVITSPYTFSACQVFIAQVDRLTNAVFVGEPSGSRPTFVGEDTQLLLPWSGTRGSVSSRLHQSSSTEERVWISPEIPVPSRAADWLAGRDAALEATLSVIRGVGP